jgi:hypothetical protein
MVNIESRYDRDRSRRVDTPRARSRVDKSASGPRDSYLLVPTIRIPPSTTRTKTASDERNGWYYDLKLLCAQSGRPLPGGNPALNRRWRDSIEVVTLGLAQLKAFLRGFISPTAFSSSIRIGVRGTRQSTKTSCFPSVKVASHYFSADSFTNSWILFRAGQGTGIGRKLPR